MDGAAPNSQYQVQVVENLHEQYKGSCDAWTMHNSPLLLLSVKYRVIWSSSLLL